MNSVRLATPLHCVRNALMLGALLAVTFCLATIQGARAQQLEPRTYSNQPIGLNFLLATYQYSWGDVISDQSLPIKDADAKVNAIALGYSRVLDFWGQSGTLAVVLPYAWVSANGQLEGQTQSVQRSGSADVALRLSVNLLGAPALSLSEFRGYRQDTIVGTSLVVTAPTGQYDSSKLINIGTNRWSFRPEIGVSKALGQWVLEGTASVMFFTDNNEFLGNNVRQQEPVYALQAHAIYTFNPKLWGALDWTYYFGGRSSVNGALNEDLQSNTRWGATLGQALNAHNAIKLYFSSGVIARTGTNFTTVGLTWQHQWGAGL